MICKAFDIVVVPFPFVDSLVAKKRPALVLSTEKSNDDAYVVLAMITSARHSKKRLDMLIEDLPLAGLTVSSVVRMKIFSLDTHIIYKKIGTLSRDDQRKFKTLFKQLFTDICE